MLLLTRSLLTILSFSRITVAVGSYALYGIAIIICSVVFGAVINWDLERKRECLNVAYVAWHSHIVFWLLREYLCSQISGAPTKLDMVQRKKWLTPANTVRLKPKCLTIRSMIAERNTIRVHSYLLYSLFPEKGEIYLKIYLISAVVKMKWIKQMNKTKYSIVINWFVSSPLWHDNSDMNVSEGI